MSGRGGRRGLDQPPGPPDRRARGPEWTPARRPSGQPGPDRGAQHRSPPTELPHWTEPPTGQVPAVLSRDAGDEGSGSGIGAPTWREEDADWVAHDEEFEPAMFGDDEVALGSLDETDSTDADRRPWEFDLDSVRPGPPARAGPATVAIRGPTTRSRTIVPITEPTQVVRPVSERRRGARPPRCARPASWPPGRRALAGVDAPGPAAGAGAAAVAGAGAAATASRSRATVPATPTRRPPTTPPTRSCSNRRSPVPPGPSPGRRARRNGLLPARMRAKRPDDVDVVTDTPLAAEPPGASVTDVPGVGLKRGGVAGLAAADRSAERDGDPQGADGQPTRRPTGRGRRRTASTSPPPRRWPPGCPAAGRGGGPRRTAPTRLRCAARCRGATDRWRTAGPAGQAPDARIRRTGDELRRTGGARSASGSAPASPSPWSPCWPSRLGTVASLVLCLVVVTFAAGECFGVLRRAGYHPATLLGLVGTISLMVGAYSKGVAAVPLVLVLITVFTLLWYLFGIERGSPVAGTAATLLTVGWVSLLGSYAGLLLSPSLFPDRHGIAFLLGAIIATVANDVGALVIGGWHGPPSPGPDDQPQQDLGGPGRRRGLLRPGLDGRRRGTSIRGHRPRPPCWAWWWPWWPPSATCASRCSSGTSG